MGGNRFSGAKFPALFPFVGGLTASRGFRASFGRFPYVGRSNSPIPVLNGYAACGLDGYLALSDDGESWTTIPSGTTAQISSIVGLADRFVFAGYGVRGVLWPDGTVDLQSGPDYVFGGASENGVAAFAANADGIMHTVDGFTWNLLPMSGGYPVLCIAVDSGRWIVGCNYGYCAYTDDLVSAIPLGSGGISVIAVWAIGHGNSRMLCTQFGNGPEAIARLDNPVLPWLNVPAPTGNGAQAFNVFAHNGDTIVFGGKIGGQCCVSLDNGVSWTAVLIPSMSFFHAVIYCDGRFLALTRNHEILESDDGLSWTDIGMYSPSFEALSIGASWSYA